MIPGNPALGETERIDSNLELVFAADLGGTHMRGALIDRGGKIHVQLKRETPRGSSPTCVVNALVDAARECQSHVAVREIAAAAIMVPGTVSKDNTFIVQAPNLTSLSRFGLKAAIEQELGCPTVLENDANAAAVGEMWLGAARGARSIVCVTLGTGVGGGMILDGKLWRGVDGSAGELGHASVEASGPECKCGSRGCLEMFASGTAIVRMAQESFSSFPDTILKDQCLTAARVYEAAKLGDELALIVFRKAAEYLGVGLANLINVIGPEVIVLGGGVANGWDLLEGPMREQITKRAIPSAAKSVIIRNAECGDNAGLLGAARLALDDLNNQR
jgi:glucokinase